MVKKKTKKTIINLKLIFFVICILSAIISTVFVVQDTKTYIKKQLEYKENNNKINSQPEMSNIIYTPEYYFNEVINDILNIIWFLFLAFYILIIGNEKKIII